MEQPDPPGVTGGLATARCSDTASAAPRPFSHYSYEWLTVDPVAAGLTSVPEQPALPSIVEPDSLPTVDAPVDEPLVPVINRAIELPAAYWQVGWPAAVPGTFLRADVTRRLIGVATGLPDPWGLAVLDGWRPLELQRQIYTAAYQDPTLSPGFVSEPSTDPRTPPPHLTGGAVDVTLTHRRRPLALGTLFDTFTAQAATAAFDRRVRAPPRDDPGAATAAGQAHARRGVHRLCTGMVALRVRHPAVGGRARRAPALRTGRPPKNDVDEVG